MRGNSDGNGWGNRPGRGQENRGLPGTRGIWLWSAVLALLCTLISYPGIWYSDSYVRVTTGGAVLNAVVKTLTGHRAPLETGNAFTVIPSFFMAVSQGLTGHVALYTFVQAFAFFAACFLLIREMNPGSWKIQAVLFACCPLIYGMSVYYEAGVGCVTGIAALMLLFRRAGEEKDRPGRAAEWLLVMFFSFVTFGYRTNALTILPVLGYALIRLSQPIKRKALLALALLAGLIMTWALPWIFDVHSQSTASVGFVWEILTAIQRMPAEEQEQYQDYLDEIGGEGATRAALAVCTEESAGSFMWGEPLGTEQLSAPGATGKAIGKYLQLMAEKPGIWFGVKRDVMERSLGIQGSLDTSEYCYNRWDQMGEYGFNDSLQRKAFYQSFLSVCYALEPFVLHPWVAFLITGLLMALAWFRKSPRRALYAWTAWMAVFYYLAYLLDTPAYDFRYFYPSMLLMLILDTAILMNGIAQLASLWSGKRGKEAKKHAAAGRHSGVQ